MEADQLTSPERPEYQKAAHKLRAVLRLSGKDLDGSEMERTLALFNAMELIDRIYDQVETDELREKIRRGIRTVFTGEPGPEETPTINAEVEKLRTLLAAGSIRRFSDTVDEIFELGDSLRTNQDTKTAIELALLEGEKTVELINLILNLDEKTSDFMSDLGALGKLMDDILDFEDDLKEGQRCLERMDYYTKALPVALKKLVILFLKYPALIQGKLLISLSGSFFRFLKRKFKI